MRAADPPGRVWPVLAVAVLAVSSASVLARLAEGAQPLALGFWRCAGVALLFSWGLRRLEPRDRLRVGAAGVALALHFWAWLASLEHTTVLRSTVLVTLGPVWTGLAEGAVWRLTGRPVAGAWQPPRRRFWWGLALALPGVALLGGSGELGAGSLRGDLLALVGGMLSSAYLLAGREVRQRQGVVSYGGWVCLVAAAALLPLALITGQPVVGFPAATWAAIAAMTVGPQLLGHMGFNYVVRWLPASVVATAILLEPVGAGLLAAAVLAEVPGPRDVAGGVLVLAGVLVATLELRGRRG